MNAAYVSAASSMLRHLLVFFRGGEQRVLELLALDAPSRRRLRKNPDTRLLVEKRIARQRDLSSIPGAVLHHLLQRDILVLRHHLAELLEVLTVLVAVLLTSAIFPADGFWCFSWSMRSTRSGVSGDVASPRTRPPSSTSNFIVRKPSKGREGRRELSDGLFDLRLERLRGGRERHA